MGHVERGWGDTKGFISLKMGSVVYNISRVCVSVARCPGYADTTTPGIQLEWAGKRFFSRWWKEDSLRININLSGRPSLLTNSFCTLYSTLAIIYHCVVLPSVTLQHVPDTPGWGAVRSEGFFCWLGCIPRVLGSAPLPGG